MFQDLIIQYGSLIGLFISSLIGSTIFIPFWVEAPLVGLIKLGVNPYLVVIVASIGSLIGTIVNYLLGYLGSGIIKRKVDAGKMDHAKKMMDKYGWSGLFVIILLPLPVDPITIFPGIARMNFIEFAIVVFLAKLAKYSLIVGLFNSLLSLLSL